jgi:hypothetical protein
MYNIGCDGIIFVITIIMDSIYTYGYQKNRQSNLRTYSCNLDTLQSAYLLLFPTKANES